MGEGMSCSDILPAWAWVALWPALRLALRRTLWHCGWHCGTVALWLCGTVALWHCGSVALWHCGSVALWHCGTVALWHCGTVALRRTLWHCGTVALWLALWLLPDLALGGALLAPDWRCLGRSGGGIRVQPCSATDTRAVGLLRLRQAGRACAGGGVMQQGVAQRRGRDLQVFV